MRLSIFSRLIYPCVALTVSETTPSPIAVVTEAPRSQSIVIPVAVGCVVGAVLAAAALLTIRAVRSARSGTNARRVQVQEKDKVYPVEDNSDNSHVCVDAVVISKP